jgi:nitrate reductase gamma subunit
LDAFCVAERKNRSLANGPGEVGMTAAVYLSVYAGLLVFVAGCLWRIREFRRLPFHLRWELYPVPHEEPGRAEHGGSYFESGNWWMSAQTVHRRGEWIAMFREVVFLKGVWEFNRGLWLPSFLFHFGLYLSITAVGLGVVAFMPGVETAGGALGLFTAALCRWIGWAGIVLVLAGSILLLVRRATDADLKNYRRASDFLNLALFIGVFGLLGAGALGRSTPMEEMIRGVWHFDRTVRMTPLSGIGIMLASALAAYIPFTHMSHFIAKYFTWHSVRWDDRRNARNSSLEGQVARSLGYRPKWAAAHIGADGKKSWAEIAAANPAEKERP